MAQNTVPVIAIENFSGLASKHWHESATLKVVNYTANNYRVDWIDYDGNPQPREGGLKPYGIFDQHTYTTHPFVLVDDNNAIRHLIVPVQGDCIAFVHPDTTVINEQYKNLFSEPFLENLSSHKSESACILDIENKTGKDFELFWINFDGERVKYKTVKAGWSARQLTYESHVWLIVRDSGDKTAYVAQQGFCRIAVE